jgi:hypothetical protein
MLDTFQLTRDQIDSAYSYESYRSLIDTLLAKGQTTGPKQSEVLTKYTQLNVQRMHRLDKTTVLMPELAEAARQLDRSYFWLVLTEGWCGDAAQIIPVFEHIATVSNGRIQTRYFLRDEHPEFMDAHLTKGGRAIPKLVVADAETLQDAAEWGPRPEPAQELYWSLKDGQVPFDELTTRLHTWYAKDKTLTTQAELLALLQQLQ